MLLNYGVGEDSWVPLDCKEIKPVNPKWNQSWIFIGRTDAEAEAPILWPPDAKNWLIRKNSDAEKDRNQEEKGTTEDEMVGWHQWLDGHEFEEALGDGDGQGNLACCNLWNQEWLNWTDLGAHWGFHANLTLPVQTPRHSPARGQSRDDYGELDKDRRIEPKDRAAPDELRGMGDGYQWVWHHKGETSSHNASWQRPYPCLQGSLERKKRNPGWIRSAEQTPVNRNVSFSPGKTPQDKQPGFTETL